MRPQGRDAVSVGSSEHFALPRVAPQLREVNVYLGWFGPLSRPHAGDVAGHRACRACRSCSKRARRALREGLHRAARTPRRAASRSSHIVAIAYDAAGRELAEVHVTGVDGYTFTGRMLAWGAERAAAGGLQGTGALGPVDGFGLVALTDGCRWAGLEQTAGAREAAEGAAAAACGCRVTRPHVAGWPLLVCAAAAALAAGVAVERRTAAPGRGAGRAPRQRQPRGRAARGGRPAQPAPAGRPADRSRASPRAAARLHPPPPARAARPPGVILFGNNAGPRGAVARPDARAAARRRRRGARDGRPGGRRDPHRRCSPGRRPASRSRDAPAAVRAAARAAARQLRGAGVNVNLAPVADVPDGAAPVMASRAFAGDAGAVAARTRAAVEGMRGGRRGGHRQALPRPRARAGRTPTTRRRRRRAAPLERATCAPFRAAIERRRAAGDGLARALPGARPATDRLAVAARS